MGRASYTFNQLLAAAVACGVLGACDGVPSADPPDYLPTPMLTIGPEEQAAGGPGIESVGPIEIEAQPGDVDPNADIWIVNLDALEEPPQVVVPNADGSFVTEVTAQVFDRIRILSRTEDAHSLPLDLEAVRGVNMTALAPLQDQSLPCLLLTPDVELDLGKGPSRRERFSLENTCTQTVNIVRTQLRFGSEGFEVEAPEAVEVGQSATIEVSKAGALDAEVWDVLLLDVEAGNTRGRYALSLWAH